MLGDLTRNLIHIYQEDLRDYQELLGRMRDYQAKLEELDFIRANISSEKKSATAPHPEEYLTNKQGQKDASNHSQKDKSLTVHEQLLADDGFEQDLIQFSGYREEVYQRLRDRAQKASEIQVNISRITGTPFDASHLKPHLNAEQSQKLSLLTKDIKAKIADVLKFDQEIIPRLKMELETVKLELHRIQGAQKTKNAYEKPGQHEARFIDKTK